MYLELVPDVVAARYNMDTTAEEILGYLIGDAFAVGGILTVRNYKIYLVLFHETFQEIGHHPYSGIPDDISYE
jgi:hypothetical protein